ncbi:MAG: NfeD family protein [Muribaculaceae bacterium]|nr:NfeD family protein [Muribaculaceae bacterium]
MSPWIIWLIAAIVLLVLEILSQAVLAFCLAAGCLVAAIVSLLTPSIAVQAISVGVAAVAAWLILAPIVRKWESKRAPKSRTGMDALLGRRAVITDEVRPGELGRARIDGDYWQVRAPGIKEPIRRGDEVSVTGYDSIILTVEPIR